MTLIELMIASTILSMIALAIGSLAVAVQQSNEYAKGNSEAMQHGRAAMTRIQETILGATYSKDFPGFVVFESSAGGWDFPDTLVVWSPNGVASDLDGLPLFSELIFYFPDPSNPRQLLEVADRTDARVTPDLSDLAAWDTELAAIKADTTLDRIVLTDMLRIATVVNGQSSGAGTRMGALRFEQEVTPSAADLAAYEAASVTWENLPWAQDLYGTERGMRQSWCRIEFQIVPGRDLLASDPEDDNVIPFFGSAALYYGIEK